MGELASTLLELPQASPQDAEEHYVGRTHADAGRTLPPEGTMCECVANHNPLVRPESLQPWPLIGGPLLWVCPITFMNTLLLLDEYEEEHGMPPRAVTSKYSLYTRQLAQATWRTLGRPPKTVPFEDLFTMPLPSPKRHSRRTPGGTP